VGSDKISVTIQTYSFSFLLLTSLLFPLRTNASVSDLVCSMFGVFCATEAKAEEIDSNLQNMPLLQASLSPIANSSTSKEISIVGGTSLSPENQSVSDSKVYSNEDQISLYVVHNGDTLPAIAKMFDVTVNTIRWANDISGNNIKPGQTLVILPISGVQHVVKSGDTLQSIAKQHKGDLEEILQFNNLTKNSKLAIGDVIVVPDGEVVSVSSGTTKSSVGVGKVSPSTPVYDGYYMRPIVGGLKTQGIHGHNGVDLTLSYGANILASADGQVIVARSSGYNGGYGQYIVIKHGNGTQTLYGHLSSVLVSVGDSVSQGQVIGKMGSTGKSTGVHLHFEIRGARNPF
jgi:LysM repeat protein